MLAVISRPTNLHLLGVPAPSLHHHGRAKGPYLPTTFGEMKKEAIAQVGRDTWAGYEGGMGGAMKRFSRNFIFRHEITISFEMKDCFLTKKTD